MYNSFTKLPATFNFFNFHLNSTRSEYCTLFARSEMTEKIFCDCRIYIVQYGLLKKRTELFWKQIVKHGGEIVSDPSTSLPTHIIIEDKFLLNPNEVKNAIKSVHLLPDINDCKIVGTLWLSKCLKEKKLLDTDTFSFVNREVLENRNNSETTGNETPVKIRKIEADNVRILFLKRASPITKTKYVIIIIKILECYRLLQTQ